tara:strand:- start:332 stop:505 length:174 start_codon:yes stop_codon:yes gene_type:complete
MMLMVELKTEKGKVSPAQQEWLDALSQVRAVFTDVWRPSGLPSIVDILSAGMAEVQL